MTARTIAASWVAVVTLVVGGCGGASSVAGFLEEANAICEQHRAAIQQARDEMLAGGEIPNPQRFARLVADTVLPELEAQFDELRGLEPPPEVAEPFEAYLTEGEEVLDLVRDDASVLTNPAHFHDVNEHADAVGLSEDCHLGPG